MRVKVQRSFFMLLIILLSVSLFFSAKVIPCLAEPPNNSTAKINAPSSAECMILLESSSNRILAGKNMDKKRPMASTTKIATAITVLENCDNIEKTVAVPSSAAGVEGSSIYLQRGEKVKIIDLLYGLMLQSGNDCAEALAITTAGSIENFAKQMNEMAKKAGATQTNFKNPHGLHHEDHYTTARDLALITSYAMKNTVFKAIIKTKKHTMPWEGRDYDRIILNKNKILNTYDGGDGVKTGFTKKAGRCLVSSATRDGMQLICVVLNCGPMFEECARMMDDGFSKYSLVLLAKKGEKYGKATVVGGKKTEIEVGINKDLRYPLTQEEQEAIQKEVILPQNIPAPIKKDENLGNLKISLHNQLLFDEKLYTINGVNELTVWDKLKDFFHVWE